MSFIDLYHFQLRTLCGNAITSQYPLLAECSYLAALKFRLGL